MVVGKDDELDKESLARVKLISDKKRQLEETADQVRNDIKGCFERLAQALKGREKQLLRQVEAIHRQQLSLVQSNSELLPALSSDLEAKLSNEQELIEGLLNFGKIELANSIAVIDSEPYKAKEYLEASEDVVSFDKSLKSENEQIDVTSVIRRKRDSFGNHTKNITINLNCTSCETRKFQNDAVPPAVAGPSRLIVDSPVTPTSPSSGTSTAASSVQQSPLKDNTIFVEIKSPMSSKSIEPPSASDKCSENVFFEFEAKNANVEQPPIEQKRDAENNASKPSSEGEGNDNNPGKTEHSIQIQQWLQKILTETETEPIIHEIGQFSSIPNSQLYREFPVET